MVGCVVDQVSRISSNCSSSSDLSVDGMCGSSVGSAGRGGVYRWVRILNDDVLRSKFRCYHNLISKQWSLNHYPGSNFSKFV